MKQLTEKQHFGEIRVVKSNIHYVQCGYYGRKWNTQIGHSEYKWN